MALNRILILIFLLSTVSKQLLAQFNDSTFNYVRYATTGVLNKTNDASSFVINNAFRYGLKKKYTSLNSNTSWVYGKQEKNLTNNDFSSTLDFNIFNGDSAKLYYWGLMNYESSYSLKVNHRLQSGVGIAYNFVDTKDLFFNISEGMLYESSGLKLTDSTNDNYNTFRNSFRVRYRLTIKDLIVLDGTNFLQNSLKNGDDYIIKSVNSLTIKLRKWLGLTTAVTYNRINQTGRENLLFTFGLTAETYF
jgi:hypothetical protein